MNAFRLALRQVAFERRAFWRNRTAAFFTFGFPLMLLAISNLLFGNEEVMTERGVGIGGSTFYVPAMAALSVITACYTNVAITTAIRRDTGILKRVRGTPLPGWAYLLGSIIHSVLVSLLLVAIVCAAGVVFYDVDLPTTTLPGFIVSLVVGAATFAGLGLAVTVVIPNGNSAPPIANGTIVPLIFVSNVLIPLGPDTAPWLESVTKLFPVRHFAEAMHAAFQPGATGSGLEWGNLSVMMLWAVAGLGVAVRYFSWEPRR